MTLDVVECGSGRDVILIHGSASDRRTWEAQRVAWCGRFHVVTYSRRYHWPNDSIPAGTAERVEIQGASHIVHEDNPAAFNRAVESFLGRRATRA